MAPPSAHANSYIFWEFYEIHPSVPRKFVPYGTWDNKNGLNLTTVKKWFRRQDLEVRIK